MSIRLRLALWYTGVLTVTLVVFGLLLFSMMSRHLMAMTDESIASTAEHMATGIHPDSTLPLSKQGLALPPIDTFEAPGVYVQLVDLDGQIVAQSNNLGQRVLPSDSSFLKDAQGSNGTMFTATMGQEKVRVYLMPLTYNMQTVGFVEVGRSYREAYDLLSNLQLTLLAGGALSLALAGTIGWAIAKGALRPIATITRTARAIAQSRSFSRRLESGHTKDEVGELGVTFNEMLASLQEAYAAQQRFIADASHELRAPLTAVRANLELLGRRAESLTVGDRAEIVQAASSEADRMGRLVSDLLSLARADAGQELRLRPTELDRLVMDVWSEARVLAPNLKVNVKEIDEATVLADPDRLKQLVLILVDNAIRYTPEGGSLDICLSKDDTFADLSITDSGVGISAEDLPHVFDRFYRADKARARDASGTGLGLSIAKWIVDNHGGDIEVESAPGKGSTFTVRLPLARKQAISPTHSGGKIPSESGFHPAR